MSFDRYQTWWSWMTLNGIISSTVRYFIR